MLSIKAAEINLCLPIIIKKPILQLPILGIVQQNKLKRNFWELFSDASDFHMQIGLNIGRDWI